jgi:hypothetical protein
LSIPFGRRAEIVPLRRACDGFESAAWSGDGAAAVRTDWDQIILFLRAAQPIGLFSRIESGDSQSGTGSNAERPLM